MSIDSPEAWQRMTSSYDCGDNGLAVFSRTCQKCGRLVRPDNSILTDGEGRAVIEMNATCTRCGRVEMPFEGFV